MFLTGAAARTEHYEIAAYTGLVAKARALGETEAAKLLNENLKQEKDALKKVETIEKDLLKSAKPNGRGTRSRSTSARRTTTTRRGASSSRKTTASSRRTSR